MHTYKTKSIEDRFYAKVLMPDENGCMNFTGALMDGYGRICLGRNSFLAHRFSYEHFIGPILNGLFVCHKCDNRRCVNPEHLFLGTNMDNMTDMIKKGRARKNPAFGERHHRTTLKNYQILEIKKMLQDRISVTEIAKKFGVNFNVISDIKCGRKWNRIIQENNNDQSSQ